MTDREPAGSDGQEGAGHRGRRDRQRAGASGLAQHGADVAVADRDLPRAEEAATRVRAFGCRTLARAVDVTDEPSVSGLAEELTGSWNGVDILVNAVGVAARMPSESRYRWRRCARRSR